MSCGLEHLANCHGELTILTTILASIIFWWRTSWNRLKYSCKHICQICLHYKDKSDKRNSLKKESIIGFKNE